MRVVIVQDDEWHVPLWVTTDQELLDFEIDLYSDVGESPSVIDLPDELVERCQKVEDDMRTAENELANYISTCSRKSMGT